jgi:hypothetical protein
VSDLLSVAVVTVGFDINAHASNTDADFASAAAV